MAYAPQPSPLPADLSADDLMRRIDAIDRELIALLATRVQVGAALLKIPTASAPRAERMMKTIALRRTWGAKAGLDRGFIEVLFATLIARDVAIHDLEQKKPPEPGSSTSSRESSAS